MQLSSLPFLTLFLPFFLAGYFFFFLPPLAKRWPSACCRLANLFLLAMSLIFYFWAEGFRTWILIAVCAVNFSLAGLMARGSQPAPDAPRTRSRKSLLLAAVAFNLAILGYYKYANFFIDSSGGLLPSGAAAGWVRIAMPVGISFFIFKALSYVVDVYRGAVPASTSFFDFSCYLAMFPSLVAGPIYRYSDTFRQLAARMPGRSRFATGAARLICGLSKKALIADTLAVIADRAFGLPPQELTAASAWLGLVCYTLQIYFDFSGYSDMAIGISGMLGFDFPENFNYPYISRSVREFWRRWHITLSSWLRDYLYIPLGGSRRGGLRTSANLLLVFFLCGLWHGASWVFVAWGVYHGIFLALEHAVARSVAALPVSNRLRAVGAALGHGYTLAVVMAGWVLFRSTDFAQALGYYKALLGMTEGASTANAIWLFAAYDVDIALTAGVLFSMPVLPLLAQWYERYCTQAATDGGIAGRVAVAGMDLCCAALLLGLLLLNGLCLASGTYNTFIYARF